jgi:predicted ferric reductase
MATIKHHGDGVEISVRMARPLKFRAGQFVYLSLWNFSSLSAFESHPLQICWAYNDEDGQQVLVLLSQARRGFTRRLLMPTRRQHPALIEGPYGKTLSLGQYGTVLLFATDMGIAGQLPYIKELLELYRQCKAKTRRVALFWELEAEGKCLNVRI